MTLFEIAMLGSLAAMAVTAAAIWLGPRADAADTDTAVRRAVPLRKALATWRDDHGNACPSVSQLVHEGYLASDAPKEDPWGMRYRLFCDSRTEVASAGRDGEFDTADDIVLRVEE